MSEKEMLVSIVIPVYNGASYLKESVEDLQKQTHQNMEIILVDDGSTDQTPALCDELAAGDPRIKVIHKKNGGVSSARNLGMQHATGEYIHFLDADDRIEHNTMEENLEVARKYQADVVLFGFWYYVEDENRLFDNRMPKDFHGTGEEFFRDYLAECIHHEMFQAPWNKLVRLEMMREKNICFGEHCLLYEDILFAAELLPKAETIAVNSKLYYKYLIRSEGSLITRFFPNTVDYLNGFYDRAMEYCAAYEQRTEQEKALCWIYTRYLFTHLKQISNRKQLSAGEKRKLVGRIISEKRFRSALQRMEYQGKKKWMKRWILKGRTRSVIGMYRLSNLLGK